MDITNLYRAKLEIVKNRSKALGTTHTSQVKNKAFFGKRSEYFLKARECMATITALKRYLHDNRELYLQVEEKVAPSNNISETLGLSQRERDEMDFNIYKAIQSCQSQIQVIQALINNNNVNLNVQPQLRTHLDNILNSLSDYIKEVSSVYSEMKAVKVKRTLGMQTMSKIYHNLDRSSSFLANSANVVKKCDTDPQNIRSLPTYLEEQEDLSTEEIQLLESENKELLDQLHSLSEHVDQIQSNVVSIAELQSIFTEKVLEQDKGVEFIANTIVNATENVKGGNEQLRQAIQQNADFRAWILFFIFVMSVSLLFLDWYNE